MPSPSPEARAGLLAALAACVLWGVLPLYLKGLREVPVFELLAWRIVFTVPAAAGAIWIMREQAGLALLKDARVWGLMALTAGLIGVNWGVYVWAVLHGQVLQASLGYFLNPLVNIALGVLFLRERLSAIQTAAVALAALGVGVQAIGVGGLPWVTLVLAFSFAFYTLVRKRAPAGPATGLFVETLILAPVAALVLLFWSTAGALAWPQLGLERQLLLFCAGALTATPLVLFAFGAQRLSMATLGLLQYLAPTMQFALGLTFGEAFTPTHAVSFGLILAGLSLFTFGALRNSGWRWRPPRWSGA